MIEKLKELYATYLEDATKVRKEAPRFAGFFGLGNDPRKHPCHEIFYDNVAKWTGEFVASQPQSAEAMEAASFILEAPGQNMESEGYWFYYACIGFVQKLIPFLSGADCKTLADRMNVLYPKIERMPLQQETYKMLAKAAKK